jgi:cytochrome c551/c552
MNQLANLGAGLMLAGAAILSHAAVHEIKLPPETAKLKESRLPGYVIATQKCAICHSADYVKYQPPGMNLAQWTAEAGKMQHLYGAPITDDDVKKIGAYLAVSYGSAKESELPADLKVAAATPMPAPAAAAASAPAAMLEAKALLNANGCLGCHAIDKKVVGPGYHEVAVKYHGDPQALAKVEASIRNGGSGKWGPVAMPPFSQLKPAEVRSLAEFVLKQ